jgi:SAM-dependent methyltransferase
MDSETLEHYKNCHEALAARYETAAPNLIHQSLLRHLPKDRPILEIGCGSGRDASFLVQNGFAITATDASGEMLASAEKCHPELKGHLRQAAFPLPQDSPMLAERYDAVVCIAMIMHVPEHELFEFATQLQTLVASGGTLIIVSSIGRSEITNQRDKNGLLFIERPVAELQLLFERLGFRLIARDSSIDSLERDIHWHSLVMQRSYGADTRPIDEIETIIRRDKKVATEKENEDTQA